MNALLRRAPVRPAPAAPAPPPPLPALAIPRGQTGRLLASLLPWLAQGHRCYCLDGGNGFNPYELAAQARRQALDPTPLLERIFVSRAYTCHQLLEAARTMLGLLADQAGLPGQPPLLALVLGLDHLFLDDDLPLAERRQVYGRLLTRLAEVRRRGLPLLATVGNAECGTRNAELKTFYAPLRILKPQADDNALLQSALSSLEFTIPHSAIAGTRAQTERHPAHAAHSAIQV